MNTHIRSFLVVAFTISALFVTVANAAAPRENSSTVLIYAVDVSGSTNYPIGNSCSNQQLPQLGPVNSPNAYLQCEIAAVVNMNRQAIENGNIGHVGLVVFGENAVAASVDPDLIPLPERELTTPDAAMDPAYTDIEYVARSIRVGMVTQYVPYNVRTGSNPYSGIMRSCELAKGSPLPNKIVVLISDNQPTWTRSPRRALSFCAGDVTVHAVVPQGTSCTTELGQVATLTGGTCSALSSEEIADLSTPPLASLSVSREHLGSFAGLGSPAWDINSREEVVGTSALPPSSDPIGRAYLWRNDRPGLLDLGSFVQFGHNGSEAWRINEAGQVAGTSFLKELPEPLQRIGFRITPRDTDRDGTPDVWFQDANGDGVNDLMEQVPPLGGPRNTVSDMNQFGQVVGESTIYPTSYDEVHAYLWSPPAGSIDLGTPGGTTSGAIAIDDSGVVLGHGKDTSGRTRYFRITPLDTDGDGTPDVWFQDSDGNGINDLMSFINFDVPAGTSFIQPWEMNNAGKIVGYAYIPNNNLGILWAPDGSATQLGTVGGASSDGFDINDLGQVAGWSITAGGTSRPVLWTRELGMVDIGELSNSTGSAFGINALGDRLVGYSSNAGEAQGAIWRIYNTPIGRNVVVDPDTGVILMFSDVTQQGYTDVVQSNKIPDDIPDPDFEFNGVYYDITTTADFTGNVRICIPSPSIPRTRLRHYVGGSWVPVSSTYDSDIRAVCAVVSSFSWFTVELNLHAPDANAGSDQVVYCDSSAGAFVDLDGSASFDPDGDAMTYTWTGAFGSASGVTPTVTLPLGKNTVSLVVSDGTNSSYPNESSVQVLAGVSGLMSPLGALTPEESELVMPDAAFKKGRTLPLRLQLYCGPTLLTDADVSEPVLESIQRIDEAQDLAVVDVDAGQSMADSDMFRYAENEWIYNMSTKGLQPGTYRIVIRMPDGMGYHAALVLK